MLISSCKLIRGGGADISGRRSRKQQQTAKNQGCGMRLLSCSSLAWMTQVKRMQQVTSQLSTKTLLDTQLELITQAILKKIVPIKNISLFIWICILAVLHGFGMIESHVEGRLGRGGNHSVEFEQLPGGIVVKGRYIQYAGQTDSRTNAYMQSNAHTRMNISCITYSQNTHIHA